MDFAFVTNNFYAKKDFIIYINNLNKTLNDKHTKV